MVIHNNFHDFVLFLYVHIALADNYLHESEESLILDKMSRLFPAETNPKKKFEEAMVNYKLQGSEKIMEIIRDTFKQYSHIKFTQKYKVYTDLYDIVNADGKVEESEMVALDLLKQIIDMNSEANKK